VTFDLAEQKEFYRISFPWLDLRTGMYVCVFYVVSYEVGLCSVLQGIGPCFVQTGVCE